MQIKHRNIYRDSKCISLAALKDMGVNVSIFLDINNFYKEYEGIKRIMEEEQQAQESKLIMNTGKE